MESAKFAEVPLGRLTQLPFPATEKHLAIWLSALAPHQALHNSRQILRVTQTIRNLNLPAELKAELLLRLSRFLPQVIEQLQPAYLNSSLPFDQLTQEHVELVVWNLVALAESCWQNLLMLRGIEQELQVLTIQVALQALSQALLHIALSYKHAPHGFWQRCYHLYAFAEHHNLQRQVSGTAGQTGYHNNLQSIESYFKLLLLFHLSEPQQFDAREIERIFHELEAFAPAAVILVNYKPEWQRAVCAFSLQQDSPPGKIFDAGERHDPDERYVYCIRVAKQVYAALQQKKADNIEEQIHQVALIKALNTLGLTRRRKIERVTNDNARMHGVVGLPEVVGFLRRRNQASSSPSKQTASIALENANAASTEGSFDLIPVGDELDHCMRQAFKKPSRHSMGLSNLVNASSYSQLVEIVPEVAGGCWFSIFDRSVKGYGLLTTNAQTVVKIGDLLGLRFPPTSKELQLCLVQRINQLTDHRLYIGVEVLSFRAEVVLARQPDALTPNSQAGIWAIFLPDAKQVGSLIFNNGALYPKLTVTLQFPESRRCYRLNKRLFINSTLTIMQLALLAEESQ